MPKAIKDKLALTSLLYKYKLSENAWSIVLGFNDTSILVGHFVHLPEKGRKEIEELVEMNERYRGEWEQELSEDNAARRKGLIG